MDYLENKARYDAMGDTVVYTGTIDAYFGYCFGKLEYRSLRFESEEEIPWALDGEFGGKHRAVEVENRKRLIQFRIPKKDIS